MIDLGQFFDGYLIEKAVNQALGLDPELALKLAELDGKRISIQLNIREQPWIMEIQQGQFLLSSDELQPCDVRLRGSLSGFLQLFKQKTSHKGVNTQIYIEGDLHSAQQFQRVMSEIRPDFEFALKQRFGNKLGGILNDGLLQMQKKSSASKARFTAQLHDFLAGADGQCVTRSEYDLFAGKVNKIRLSLDRLEARMTQLERK